jgi:hypothetical protein
MTDGAGTPQQIAERLWIVETPLSLAGVQVGRRTSCRRAGCTGTSSWRTTPPTPRSSCSPHRRTLVVGDLVWSVTNSMATTGRLWAGWRTGVRPTPAFRLAIRDRPAARRALDRILEWDFDRLLTGHGEIVASGGREALSRAFAWLR